MRTLRSVVRCGGFRAAGAVGCGSPGRAPGRGSGPPGRSVARFPSRLRVALLTVRGGVCASLRCACGGGSRRGELCHCGRECGEGAAGRMVLWPGSRRWRRRRGWLSPRVLCRLALRLWSELERDVACGPRRWGGRGCRDRHAWLRRSAGAERAGRRGRRLVGSLRRQALGVGFTCWVRGRWRGRGRWRVWVCGGRGVGRGGR